MELEAERAFVFGGLGGVSDAFDSVEPSLVDVAFDHDFQGVPVLGFDRGDGFFSFDGVALARNVGGSGEVALERTGDSDLDLVVVALEHNAGVDGAFTVFVVESEGEIGEFFVGPENGTGFLGAGLAMKNAVFHGPVFDLALGIDPPVREVFSVEERFGVGKSGEGEEKWENTHDAKDTEEWEWIQH